MTAKHQKKSKKWQKFIIIFISVLVFVAFFLFLLQKFWAHRDGYFVPDYGRVELTENSDYETIFLQTGLGRPAAEKLIADGDFNTVLEAQELFFDPPEAECTPLLGWFTREDRLETPGPDLVDLRPGDILITLSTHSLGWRHGHAGLVIDSETTLECAVLGTDSKCFYNKDWNNYSGYAVLRLRDAPEDIGQEIADYGTSELTGIPYHLSSGFLGPKAPDPDDPQFGLHCSYLIWYAYDHFGFDLDSDGGRLASSYDILHSDLLEVVQVYGMDPRQFTENEE